jgi:phosphate transport system permease protein
MTTTMPPPTVTPTLPPAAPPPTRGTAARVEVDDFPRDVRQRTTSDILTLVGSGIGSLSLDWILFERVLPFSGGVGFFVCWYLLFLCFYAGLTALDGSRALIADRLASAAVHGGAAIAGLGLVTAVVFTFSRGYAPMGHINSYTHDAAGAGPQDPLSRGGFEHAIVGSLIEVGMAIAIIMPLGIGAAIYTTEARGRLPRIVKIIVEAMTALPSIVAGLFIYSTWIIAFHQPKSGFAATLALSVEGLPIVARASDVVLRVVPGGLREASLALGAPRWRTVWNVLLPTARPGLATALILAVARIIGEGAPVLLVSGASTYFNKNPFKGSMNSLPLYILTAVRSGEPKFIVRGFGAASVLLALVLILFAVARRLARQKTGSR